MSDIESENYAKHIAIRTGRIDPKPPRILRPKKINLDTPWESEDVDRWAERREERRRGDRRNRRNYIDNLFAQQENRIRSFGDLAIDLMNEGKVIEVDDFSDLELDQEP